MCSLGVSCTAGATPCQDGRRQAEARPSLRLVLKWASAEFLPWGGYRGVFPPSQGRECQMCPGRRLLWGDRMQRAKGFVSLLVSSVGLAWQPEGFLEEGSAGPGQKPGNKEPNPKHTARGHVSSQGLLALAAFPGVLPEFPTWPFRSDVERQSGQSWWVSGKLQQKSCHTHLFLRRDVLCVGLDPLCRKQGTSGTPRPPLTSSELSDTSEFSGFPESEDVGARKHRRKRLGSVS